MSDWIHSSVIRWFKPKDEMPEIKKGHWEKWEDPVSKPVLLSTEYNGQRSVIADARYNFREECWELLIDSTGDYWKEVFHEVHVEFWAYYPDPIIPCEE